MKQVNESVERRRDAAPGALLFPMHFSLDLHVSLSLAVAFAAGLGIKSHISYDLSSKHGCKSG